MLAILHRLPIADIVNARIISLEDAAQEYGSFDQEAATKFVLDPQRPDVGGIERKNSQHHGAVPR